MKESDEALMEEGKKIINVQCEPKAGGNMRMLLQMDSSGWEITLEATRCLLWLESDTLLIQFI